MPTSDAIGPPIPRRRWRVRPIAAWFDLWVGVFVDRPRRRVYVLPIPCIGIVVEWGR